MSSILPDEAVFADFKRQCLSTDSWANKFDGNGMQVWVEVPAKKEKRGPKIHKIRVSFIAGCDAAGVSPPSPAMSCDLPNLSCCLSV